eukprot:jgi/Picre1/32993/NNA_008320.t1
MGLVVLHPYSLLGGSMNDAIVTEVMRQSQALKYFGAVLCYNMRGVGGSEGNKMSARNLFGSGQEDAADVHHVIDWLVARMQEVLQGQKSTLLWWDTVSVQHWQPKPLNTSVSQHTLVLVCRSAR